MGFENVERLRTTGQAAVYAVWHGQMLPVFYRHRHHGVTLLISSHADGGYLAHAAARWGYRVLRGSSTRGGLEGLWEAVRTLRAGGEIAVTPDGPRGPAFKAKRGAVLAARRARVPVVAVAARASRAWSLRSWDGFQIPKPFARIRIIYDAPLYPGNGLDAGLIEARLNDATARAEDRVPD